MGDVGIVAGILHHAGRRRAVAQRRGGQREGRMLPARQGHLDRIGKLPGQQRLIGRLGGRRGAGAGGPAIAERAVVGCHAPRYSADNPFRHLQETRPMTAPGLIVAAPRSGAGKTTLTLALLAALSRRGIVVQAAKVGPDYIDPSFHAAATGRPSFNLDSWAMPPSLIDALVAEHAAHADLLVIEGAMGLFDGVPAPPLRTGASADLAARLGLPVLLVIDVAGQSQSAAAVVRGFASHQRDVRIGGVVLNRVGSERHVRLVAEAIAALDIPVLGAIPRDASLALPERHLGLVQATEHANLAARLEHLADMAEHHLDIDAIKQLAVPPHRSAARLDAPVPPPGRRIALAQDDAFSFVYPHVLDGWRARGRRDRALLAARRRGPAGGLRQLLASRRLSGASRRGACRRRSVPRRRDAVRHDAAGAWRVRRLHGAWREPRGRRRRQPPHAGAARPRHQLRASQAASRLSPGAAAIRQPVGKAGDAPAGARIPLCRLDLARSGRAVGGACRQPGRRTRRSRRTARATSPAPSSTPSPRSKRPSPRPAPAGRSPCRCGRRARRARSARRPRRRSLRQAACRDRASGCRPSS